MNLSLKNKNLNHLSCSEIGTTNGMEENGIEKCQKISLKVIYTEINQQQQMLNNIILGLTKVIVKNSFENGTKNLSL